MTAVKVLTPAPKQKVQDKPSDVVHKRLRCDILRHVWSATSPESCAEPPCRVQQVEA